MEKLWLCKNQHILGAIQWNGNNLPYLLLYRHAIDLGAREPEAVDVVGPLMGQMPVKCDICDDVQLWKLSPKALAQFMKNLNKGEREEVEAHLRKGHVRKTQKIANRAKVRNEKL